MSLVDTLEFDDGRVARAGGADTRPEPAWYDVNWDATKASAEQAFSDVLGRSSDKRSAEILMAAAELTRLNGKSMMAYTIVPAGVSASAPVANEAAFWNDLAEARRTRGDALSDFARDRGDFDAKFTARMRKATADREQRMSRGGVLGNLLGGVAGAFTDPINIATLPLGGGGRTAAGKIITEGLTQMGVEVVTSPLTALERDRQGGELTLKEAAWNVGLAGIGGAALKGAEIGGGKAISAARNAVPKEVKAAIALRNAKPDYALTPDQAAALHVVTRGAEIDAVNPFVNTYDGLEAHAARVDETIAAMSHWPEPVAVSRAAIVPGRASTDTGSLINDFMVRARGAESGGNDAARNPLSSAAGRYQFTDGTWLRSYKKRFGAGDLTNAQILAKKSDAGLQDMLMRDLTLSNATALTRAGVPVTQGNLYLAHFAGDGGARKLHAADPATPAIDVLGAKVIKANPFLKDMNAGEVIAWADRKMGGDTRVAAGDAGMGGDADAAIVRPAALDAERPLVDMPELDRSLFRSEAEWRRAQDEIDAEAFGHDPSSARQTVWEDARDRLMADRGGEVSGALWHPEIGAIDVKWGDAQTGLAKIAAKHPEVLEDLPSLLEEMTIADRSREGRVTLESADHLATVRLDWDGKAQNWLLTAFQREEPKLRAKGEIAPSSADHMRAGESAGASPTAGALRDIALERAGVQMAPGIGDPGKFWEAALGRGDRARPVHAIVGPDGLVQGWETSAPRAARQLERLGIEDARIVRLDPPRHADLATHPAARDELEAEGLAGAVVRDIEAGKAFDDPTGDGVARAAETAWHDVQANQEAIRAAGDMIDRADAALRQLDPEAAQEIDRELAVATRGLPEQMTFDLGDGHGERSLDDITAELKADENAIAAIEACLKPAPMGGGA